MQNLKRGKTYGFRLSGISLRMIEKIIQEEEIFSPSELMRKVISEFVELKYGCDEYAKIRRQFIEDVFGDI